MPLPNWQVFDRIRAFTRQGNIFRADNIYQDQDALDRVISGGNFIDFSRQSALLEQTNLQINRLERYKDYDMMDEVGEITLALDMYCIAGETRIPLLNGTYPTIKELAESGLKEYWVYAYDVDKKEYVPARAHNAHISGHNADLFEIEFDDGLIIRCTGKHKILTKDGYVTADKLKIDQSVVPLYKTRKPPLSAKHFSLAEREYEHIRLESGKWKPTHQWIYEAIYNERKGVIHHKDFDKYNNAPDNLELMTWKAHAELHRRYAHLPPEVLAKKRAKISQKLREKWKDPEYIKKLKSHCREMGRQLQTSGNAFRRMEEYSAVTWETLCKYIEQDGDLDSIRKIATNLHCAQRVIYRLLEKQGITIKDLRHSKVGNHKISSIKKIGKASEVYDLCVDKYHNFAAGDKKSWVIIHNSDEASLADPERKHSVIIKARDSRLRKVIEDFLYNTLLIDKELRPIIRYLCKYGDFPAEIVPTKNRDGVASFRFINVYNFTRIQTKFGDLVGFYYQDPTSMSPVFLHPWQTVHMRLTTYENVYHPYGRCCTQGTLIQTPNGEVPIENLKSNDEAYCFDGYKKIRTKIIGLVNNGMKMTYSLHTANRRLDLTSNHPVMLLQNKEVFYKPVHQICEGDLLLAPQPDGTVEAEGISRIEKRDMKQVFDIGVESDNHNFVANGAVVHNSVLDGGRKDFKRLRLMEDAALVYRICVRGDTRVSTPDKYKYIKDIEVGDTVHCFDRDGQVQETRVKHQVCNGKDRIYRVFSRHREIFANATHPILVVSPYKRNKKLYLDRLEYVDVQDLKHLQNTNQLYCHRFLLPKFEEGKPIRLKCPQVPQYMRVTEDIPLTRGPASLARRVRLKKSSACGFLAGSHHLPADAAVRVLDQVQVEESDKRIEIYECWSFCSQTGTGVEYKVPEFADEDFARWFGFMIGDGFVSERHNASRPGCYQREIGFALGDKVQINEKYRALFEKIVGKVSYGRDTGHRLGSYYVYSRLFLEFMQMNGFIPGAENKRIPHWVYESPQSIQSAFIEGYLDADCSSRYFKGGVTEGHTIECCNKQLVEDFKELIDRIGWTAGLVGNRQKKGGHIIDKNTGRQMPDTEAWTLYFTKRLLPEHERILGVEEVGEDLVYDITVENPIHNFVANALCAHNTRAPEKRIFSIPVGNIPPKEVPQYIELIARQFKKFKFVDPASGSVNERYSPLIQEDDFFLPKRPDGTGPTIDTLPGAENLDAIADIEYFKKKMVAGLKIPFSRVGIGDQSEPDGKSLAQSSPEFAKGIQWIQKEVISGLKKLCVVHLALRGHSIEDIKSFDLYMTAASAIDELYRIETWNTRADIMGNLKDIGWFPPEWIIERFTDMSQDEIREMKIDSGNDLDAPEEESTNEDKNLSNREKYLLSEYKDFNKRVKDNLEDEDQDLSNVGWMLNAKELDGLPEPIDEDDEDNKDTKLLVEVSISKDIVNEVCEETKSMLLGGISGGAQIGEISMVAETIPVENENDDVDSQKLLVENIVDEMDEEEEK